MKNFGVDIWTWTDVVCHNSTASRVNFKCPGKDDYLPILPMAMITSRRENDSHMRRYYLDANKVMSSNNSLQTFLSNYNNGKLTPDMKSQQNPPENRTTSGVHIITANSFESEVMQTDKNVLIQFFAPSCGHCKRFNILWNKIARFTTFMNWDSIIQVSKMDISKNEVFHDEVEISRVPSVYVFFKGRKDKPIKLRVEGDDEERGYSNVGGLSNITAFMDWMIGLGRIDENELLTLASQS